MFSMLLFYQLVAVVNTQLLVKSSIYVSPHINTLNHMCMCMHAYLHTQVEVFRFNLTVLSFWLRHSYTTGWGERLDHAHLSDLLSVTKYQQPNSLMDFH